MSRSSAAQRDSNATQEEKQQKKHKKHTKQYSEEETTEETPEGPKEEHQTEEPKEEQPNQQKKHDFLNKILNSQAEIDKIAEEASQSKPYISFGKLYYEYSMKKFKGPGCKNLTKLIITISDVSKPTKEYKYDDDKERFVVKYSVLEFLEQFNDNGVKTWESFDIIGMIKEYQSEFPDKYDYRYCLSDRLTVTKDVAGKILKNNGIFTIYVKWYDNEEYNAHKFIYNNNMKNGDGLSLTIPKTEPDFKEMINSYKEELPEFINKYIYNTYNDITKINAELDEKRRREQFNRKSRFMNME